MIACKCTKCADSVFIAVGTGGAADNTAAIQIFMLGIFSAGYTNALSVVSVMFAGSSRIAEDVGVVFTLLESESNLSALGNKKFVSLIAQNSSAVKHSRTDIVTLISVGHIPVEVVGRFNTYVAVFGKCYHEFAVFEAICAQILKVTLVAIISTVYISEKIHILSRLRITANRADAVYVVVITKCTCIQISVKCAGLNLAVPCFGILGVAPVRIFCPD